MITALIRVSGCFFPASRHGTEAPPLAREFRGVWLLEHDPEKWVPGFSEKIMLQQKDRAG
jgi:hypothetical protein